MIKPVYIKSKEAAEILGVSVGTLQRWRKDEANLKYYQPKNRLVRYKKTEVLALAKKRKGKK